MLKKIIAIALFGLGLGLSAHAQTEETEALKDKLYTSIIQAYNVKNWTEVDALIKRLLEAGANIDELEITYAEALGELGQPEEGISRLKAYVGKAPDDFRAYNMLGDLYEKTGNASEAIEAYEKSASMRPDFARPMVAAARLQAESDPAKAMANYNRAIDIFLNAKRPDAAIQLGTEAMKIDPENIDLLMLMGDALTRAGMVDYALSFYTEVIVANGKQGNPDPGSIIESNYNIAMIYFKKHEYDKALTFLQSLLANTELMESDKDAQALALSLAAACENRKGDQAAADALLEQAKAVSPDTWQRDYDAFLSLE